MLAMLKPTSVTARRLAWFLVLVQGMVIGRFAIDLPWYTADSPAVVVDPVDIPVEAPRSPMLDTAAATTAVAASPPNTNKSHLATIDTVGRCIGIFWITGICLLPAYWSLAYWRFVRRISAAREAPRQWQEQWQCLLDENAVRATIPLRVVERIGPGLCRLPSGYCVVIPIGFWRQLDRDQRLAILKHELEHFVRGDTWKSLVARILALPQWFNPAAWFAVRRFDECGEWACDQAATRDMPAHASRYARALLKLGSLADPVEPCMTGVRGGRLLLRIRRVLSTHKKGDSRMKKLLLSTIVFGLVVANVFRVQLVAQQLPDDALPAEKTSDVSGQPADSAVIVRSYKLRQAKAEDVVASLRKLLEADKEANREGEQLRMAADDRVNAVIIAASEEMLNKVERLLRRIDNSVQSAPKPTKDTETAIKVFHLKYVTAKAAESIARQLYADAENVKIVVDARTNSVIVSSPQRVAEKIEALFRVLDSNKKPETAIAIPGQDAPAIARALEQQLDESNIKQPVQIHLIDGVIILRGERDDVKKVQKLLGQLNSASAQTKKPELQDVASVARDDVKVEGGGGTVGTRGAVAGNRTQKEVGGFYARQPNDRSLDLVAMTDSLSAAIAARSLAKHEFIRIKKLHDRKAATDSQFESIKIKLETAERKISLFQQLLSVALNGAEREVASLAEQNKLVTEKFRDGRLNAFEVKESDRSLNAAQTYMRLLQQIYDNSKSVDSDP